MRWLPEGPASKVESFISSGRRTEACIHDSKGWPVVVAMTAPRTLMPAFEYEKPRMGTSSAPMALSCPITSLNGAGRLDMKPLSTSRGRPL